MKFTQKVISVSMCEIKATGESRLNDSHATIADIL